MTPTAIRLTMTRVTMTLTAIHLATTRATMILIVIHLAKSEMMTRATTTQIVIHLATTSATMMIQNVMTRVTMIPNVVAQTNVRAESRAMLKMFSKFGQRRKQEISQITLALNAPYQRRTSVNARVAPCFAMVMFALAVDK